MRSILYSVFIFLASIPALAQINPASQIRWPAVSGTGAPTSTCSTRNYGEPYTNITTGAYYSCSTIGWVLVSPSGVAAPINATSINNSGSYTQTGSASNLFTGSVSVPSIKIGSSSIETGVQGTSLTLSAASGVFTSGNLRQTDSNGNSVDSGVPTTAIAAAQATANSATSAAAAAQATANAVQADALTGITVYSANGVSATSSGGLTPTLTFSLGAINPTLVNNEIRNQGAVTNSSPAWQLLTTLPASNAGTYDHVQVSLLGGAWTTNQMYGEYTFHNRNGFQYFYYQSGVITGGSGVQVYANADGSASVYAYTAGGFYTSNYSVTLNNNTTLVANSPIISTTPTGTLEFDSTNTVSYPPVYEATQGVFQTQSLLANKSTLVATGASVLSVGTNATTTQSSASIVVGGTTAPGIELVNSGGGGVLFRNEATSGDLHFYTFTGALGSESYTNVGAITSTGLNGMAIGQSTPEPGSFTSFAASSGTIGGSAICTVNGTNCPAVSSAVSSVFGRTGAVTAASGDYSVSQVTGAAPLASPAFTGTPTANGGSAICTANGTNCPSSATGYTLGGSVSTSNVTGTSGASVSSVSGLDGTHQVQASVSSISYGVAIYTFSFTQNRGHTPYCLADGLMEQSGATTPTFIPFQVVATATGYSLYPNVGANYFTGVTYIFNVSCP